MAGKMNAARTSRRWSFAIITGLLMAVAAGVVPAQATTTHTAILYGDSLAWETTVNLPSCPKGTACHTTTVQQFMAAHAGWKLILRTIRGVAPCDYLPPDPQAGLPGLANDLATYHPNVVMLETEGNSFPSDSNCMVDPSTGLPYPLGSKGYYDVYTQTFDSFFYQVAAAGSKMMVVPPIPVSDSSASQVAGLDQIAATEAAKFPHTAVTTKPRDAVTKLSVFTFKKACLSTEGAAKGCVNGQITVRAPDGIHFCPPGITTSADPTQWGCSTYSGGAYRFGNALVNRIMWAFTYL